MFIKGPNQEVLSRPEIESPFPEKAFPRIFNPLQKNQVTSWRMHQPSMSWASIKQLEGSQCIVGEVKIFIDNTTQ